MAEQTLGDLLRRLRKAKGWRLEDTVSHIREAGWLTSTSTLSRFENGSRSPSAEKLRELLHVYGADDATRALATKLPRTVPPYTDAEKSRTRKRTTDAVHRGLLPLPEKCEECSAPQVVSGNLRGANVWSVKYHHPDYAKPAYVIPLCDSCHAQVHKGSIPEPRTGRIYGEEQS